jgi:hypothetical protein
MEGMSTPRERLQKHMTVFRSTPGNEDAFRPTVAAANVDCAIEITEALIGLTVAVQSMETKSVIVMNNLIKKLDEATVQAAESSKESGKVAAESANLSQQLNSLTIWIIIAAFLSAIAAVVQAGVAVVTLTHPH